MRQLALGVGNLVDVEEDRPGNMFGEIFGVRVLAVARGEAVACEVGKRRSPRVAGRGPAIRNGGSPAPLDDVRELVRDESTCRSARDCC